MKNEVYYQKFLAEIYDEAPYFGQTRSNETDKFNSFYYNNLKDNKGKILELGCGTGVLTIPLAKAGHKLDSVDLSEHMQNVLSAKLKNEHEDVSKNIRQFVFDATKFKGEELYSAIVMSGVIVALPDADLQIDLLNNCYQNLEARGRIYMDFPQPMYKVIRNGELSEFTRFRTKNGELYFLNINYKNNEYTQVQDWNVIFTKMEKGRKGEVIDIDLKIRYIFSSEIELMLKKCGFKMIEIDTNYADGLGFSVIAEKV